MCVVYDGYTKAEACIAGEALDRKSACEVGRNYAKFEFTVVNVVENKESPCRLGWFNTFLLSLQWWSGDDSERRN